eukprot:TRINITY_DN784_c0_g2_i1.p1 TRINITY_DN784_c0_g2~~TRINITY_DN784_c0_g2_i1.p1  ORF type:complete len:492 (-),score=178.36 TRINITY_DN784_c0_g2_i1:382-1830(-)
MANVESRVEALRRLHDTLRCYLCKQLVDNPYTLNCGHTFCGGCIKTHLHSVNQCPECGTFSCPREMRRKLHAGHTSTAFQRTFGRPEYEGIALAPAPSVPVNAPQRPKGRSRGDALNDKALLVTSSNGGCGTQRVWRRPERRLANSLRRKLHDAVQLASRAEEREREPPADAERRDAAAAAAAAAAGGRAQATEAQRAQQEASIAAAHAAHRDAEERIAALNAEHAAASAEQRSTAAAAAAAAAANEDAARRTIDALNARLTDATGAATTAGAARDLLVAEVNGLRVQLRSVEAALDTERETAAIQASDAAAHAERMTDALRVSQAALCEMERQTQEQRTLAASVEAARQADTAQLRAELDEQKAAAEQLRAQLAERRHRDHHDAAIHGDSGTNAQRDTGEIGILRAALSDATALLAEAREQHLAVVAELKAIQQRQQHWQQWMELQVEAEQHQQQQQQQPQQGWAGRFLGWPPSRKRQRCD